MKKKKISGITLADRSDKVMESVALLGLIASIADGQADEREINHFSEKFREQYALSRNQLVRLMGLALKQIKQGNPLWIMAKSFKVLNDNLGLLQKMALLDMIAEVLVVDGKVHEGEEDFLDFVASNLRVAHAIDQYYPADQQR